ncbi:MAG: class I SAM-dependent methyltransferase [Candidatus Diapherotrites archaeon]|nr:class I SAM-dependent methyltransferase [Candidatus Diapherotrites archaeon]
MNKTSKSHKPKESKNIFTEGIDYSKTKKSSIWGFGDNDTLKILKSTKIQGKWLNLAAGDGRYNLGLLEKADMVVVSDIDEGALNKLIKNTPVELKHKLKTKVFDITKEFPFEDSSFEGVICTGTLHLFPKEVLRQIFSEIDRVLKPQGKIIVDFAVNIKRVLPNNQLHVKKFEPVYGLEEATRFLEGLLKDYRVKVVDSVVPNEEVKVGDIVYMFSCGFILLTADKN